MPMWRAKGPSWRMHQLAAMVGRRCKGLDWIVHHLGVEDNRMQLRRADVRKRGMGPYREMFQLGATVGDGCGLRGRADGRRHGKGHSLEIHQPDAPLGDTWWQRRLYVDRRLRGKGPSQERHHLAAEGREDRRRRRRAHVRRGKGPSWRMHQLGA